MTNTDSEVYPSQPIPNELFEQVVKMNSFSLEKPKFYMQSFQEGKAPAEKPRDLPKNTKEENLLNVDRDGSYASDNENNKAAP